MDAPKFQQQPLDPTLSALMAQTQQQDISAIQTNVRGDTASLMARYGTRLALANQGGSAAVTPGSPLGMKAA